MSLSRDSVLFPSPEYIQECINNADRLREEWEKRGLQRGDWCCLENGFPWLFNACDIETPSVMAMFEHGDLIPLFQPRQIIEMLEERGHDWELYGYASGGAEALIWYREGDSRIFKGPDPETALLRAYLEVVKSR